MINPTPTGTATWAPTGLAAALAAEQAAIFAYGLLGAWLPEEERRRSARRKPPPGPRRHVTDHPGGPR